ncbi:MAG: ATP-binding protein [Acidimicrobiales bacterium]
MSLSVFLLTDIEGSTRLWAAHPSAMDRALRRHDQLLTAAITDAGGTVFKHTGDGMLARFEGAGAAILAAVTAQRAMAAEPWGELGRLRIRIGIHAGEATERDGDWFGPTLNRAARLMAVGHGGQILVSVAAAALARDQLPSDVSLVDLGTHLLRDLSEPETISQMIAADLDERFPPLRSLDRARTNLKPPLTSFLGRDADVASVVDALHAHRLVTLVGPGGIGKTRLSIQAAAELSPDVPDGVWLCELAAVSDRDAVDHTLLSALELVVRAGTTPREALIKAIAERKLLIVLDNCEHVRDIAAELTTAVLRAGPNVRVLATSREPLGVAGEWLWSVEPLPVDTEAVALFAERVRAVRRDFVATEDNAATLREICRQLDGMPLALELAAARCRSLSVGDLRSRLGERFRLLGSPGGAGAGRQATLRATLDWSYELLTAAERQLFDRLSIFVGGFSLPAAVAVSAPQADEFEVLDLLTALVDKSMIQLVGHQGETRYRMLETMRYYGAEQLAAAGEDQAVAQGHAEYFADFAVQAEAGLRTAEEARWVAAIDADFDNLRAALQWALDHRQPGIALPIAGSLWTYPIDRMVMEPAEWAERALGLPGAETHPWFAPAAITAGYGAQQTGRYHDTVRWGRLAADHANNWWLWLALGVWGSGAIFLGDDRELIGADITRLVSSARDTADDYVISRALWFPVSAHRVMVGVAAPHDLAQESLERALRVQNPTAISRAHILLGISASTAEPDRAEHHLNQAEYHANLVGGRYEAGQATAIRGAVVATNEPLRGALELLRSLQWHQAIGSPIGILRLVVADVLPALSALGLHEQVVTIAPRLPPLGGMLIGEDCVRQAVADATDALGPAKVDALRAQTAGLSEDALFAELATRLAELAQAPPREN